jgi:carboxyl-terminal processing protease
MSTRKIRSLGLVSVGIIAGVLLSVGISAVAQRGSPLPLDELRQFSSVFSAIKNNYVEPVPDKKLISGAIAGMLSDLDPHSAYLDADAFKENKKQQIKKLADGLVECLARVPTP